jgi:hypothetical protein
MRSMILSLLSMNTVSTVFSHTNDLGLAEKVSERCHVFCLDEAVGHLINQAEPASRLTNIGGCWEVPDGLNVFVCRLDPLLGDLEPSELHGLLGEHKLVRGEYHPVVSDHWMMSSTIFS